MLEVSDDHLECMLLFGTEEVCLSTYDMITPDTGVRKFVLKIMVTWPNNDKIPLYFTASLLLPNCNELHKELHKLAKLRAFARFIELHLVNENIKVKIALNSLLAFGSAGKARVKGKTEVVNTIDENTYHVLGNRILISEDSIVIDRKAKNYKIKCYPFRTAPRCNYKTHINGKRAIVCNMDFIKINIKELRDLAAKSTLRFEVTVSTVFGQSTGRNLFDNVLVTLYGIDDFRDSLPLYSEYTSSTVENLSELDSGSRFIGVERIKSDASNLLKSYFDGSKDSQILDSDVVFGRHDLIGIENFGPAAGVTRGPYKERKSTSSNKRKKSSSKN